MKRIISSVFSVSVLLAACSGDFTKIGDAGGGSAGSGNAGSTGSGNAGSTSGGSCEALPCGAVCSLCDASDAECVAGYCDGGGHCGLAFPLCEATECENTEDCPQPGAPCQQCQDGSFACPAVECFAGQCLGSFPTCQDLQCASDRDCPQVGAPCQACADGSTACPFSRCESGSCVSGSDACPDSNPCEGKACGETCTLTAPGNGAAAPAALLYCDQNQQCQFNQPVCNEPVCRTDDDCPGVGACPACPDSDACAEMRCVEGACQFQCPSGQCGAQGDSCANGESCCGGFECCSGVPTPPGKEYCGEVCPISDRNIKRDFASVDQTEILSKVVSLPISSWAYKTEDGTARHIGPMAQDFMATFQLGSSDKTILQVDADGVALAAIQALHARLENLEQRNAELERELRVLKTR